MSNSRPIVQGYYPTIGIECHVQLSTKTKLFVPISNEAREAEPNTLISHVCFGLPGALPVLNKEAVRLASKAAFALGTKPQKFSKFDRKHYFYPDLPKGYQISQFDEPIILGGAIDIVLPDGTSKTINITRAHMEEDAGKSTHPTGADYSLVDLNRAGTPLLEIVSEPEIFTAEEAKAYAKELWLRMKFADVSDVDLYHGNMRFDVNVSVSKDVDKLGTRSETKNLNSFRSVERAVEYEVKRQIELLESGGEVVQETRGWLDDKQKTVSQRSKEDAHDYRYFPDPDIPPIVLDDAYISEIEKDIPTMPDVWRSKLCDIGLDYLQSELLLEAEADLDCFLDFVVSRDKETSKLYANWIANIEIPLRRSLKEKTEDIEVDSEFRSWLYSGVNALFKEDKISSNNAKLILEQLLLTGDKSVGVSEYAEKQGMIQMSDDGAIEEIVQKVIDDNPKPVEDVKNGEMKAIGFLVGQVMKASQGKANPAKAKAMLQKKIGV